MRILFALPGLHRVGRGAEVAFESIAQEIARSGKHEVKLIGSGTARPDRAYCFEHADAIPRERFEKWPNMPFLRNQFSYEDLTFAAALMRKHWRNETDITVTCNYPYTNWALRTQLPGRRRPAHVFVTQNGDWPAYQRRREYQFFNCEGLVCTNPLYWARNRERWFSTLIPNGIDPTRFHPGPGDRARLGLPENRPIVLMVSALDQSKRVFEGLRAVSKIDDLFCVLAGDGPLRSEVDQIASELLPGRFLRQIFPHELMPMLYRSVNVFLHTAIGESFGNVYIEALGSGVPAVVHDDEITRWIFGNHGHLVDTTAEKVLVGTLRDVLRAPGADAAAGIAFATARYSWSAVASRYSEFFIDVLDRQGGRQNEITDRRSGNVSS